MKHNQHAPPALAFCPFLILPAVGGLLWLVVLGGVTWAQTGRSLASQLDPLIRGHRGQVAVAVEQLDTGVGYRYRADEPMPTASLIKLPVMIETYRQAQQGSLNLDEKITLREEDKVPGSGILTPHFSAGTTLSVRDAVRLMIAYSDNTATNLVIDRIGLASTSQLMADLGCPNTQLHAKVFRRDTSIAPERSRQFGLGSTTANEMVKLLTELHQHKLVSPPASREMLAHLYRCDDDSKIVRLLPRGIRVAHKTGAVTRARCDAGIIDSPAGPIAVCVLTAENEDRSWGDDNAGNRLCAEVARVAYRHFNPPNEEGGTAQLGVPLSSGSQGTLVELLQRTLNARLDPSPDLAVDGAFGPITRDAVIRFQVAHGLAASGVMGPETWKELGPLVSEDASVPDPETVNHQQLPKAPPEVLAGPPLVTCRAWVIGDARTGEILWSADAEKRLDPASTTKIMTALVIFRLVEENPAVLRERVTISQAADDTGGSTADVRAGETLSVEELLYGLLLPSGNDAAIALAEHFGDRFEPRRGPGAAGADNVDRFVAQMNRVADDIGLAETHFANPHGFTHPEHKTSARDLLKLGWHAMQRPLYRKYVSTRQHGCRVVGRQGYQRNVIWKNTNRLLGIEGYDGVKTGTTTAAGACLVSRGTRDDDALMIVVLGATSSDARYTDTRNLFRWAWGQREND